MITEQKKEINVSEYSFLILALFGLNTDRYLGEFIDRSGMSILIR